MHHGNAGKADCQKQGTALSQDQKLLVYIPTFQGAHRIIPVLKALVQSARGCVDPDFVRLHVSDNHSTDDAPKQIERFLAAHAPFSWDVHVNGQNIGATQNVMRGFHVDANQDYLWILGDDDLITVDALPRLESLLNAVSESDQSPALIQVNCLTVAEAVFAGLLEQPLVAHPELLSGAYRNRRHTALSMDTVGNSISVDVDDSLFGATMCSVYKASVYRDRLGHASLAEYGDWESATGYRAETIFPHAYHFFKLLQPDDVVVFDPYVYSINTVGHQSWFQKKSIVIGLGTLDLLLSYRDFGLIDGDLFSYQLASVVAQRFNDYAWILDNDSDAMSRRQLLAFSKAVVSLLKAGHP